MRIFRYIPLLAILLVLYNVISIFKPMFRVNAGLIPVPMLRPESTFLISTNEFFAMLGIVLLYFEVIKATRTSRDSMVDHALSVMVLIICLVELLVVPFAASSAFLILTLLSLIDVLMGFTVTFATSRRDVSVVER